MAHNVLAIIPAAGKGQRMLSMTENCPKSMLPVANKPLIAYHLDKLIEQNISDVCIVVGYKKEILVNYVSKVYGDKLNISFIEQTELLGLAHAIYTALTQSRLDNYDGLLIMLGDIIIQDDYIFTNMKANTSFVCYKPVDDYSRWCLLKMNEDTKVITGFIDKPNVEPKVKNAIIGVYYFNNISAFIKSLDKVIDENIRIKNEYQLSSVMEIYINEHKQLLKGLKCDKWYDFGELETYNESKKYFNLTRIFNNVDYDDNSIVKTSSNYNKIQREILWYLSLPNSLHHYVPRLIDYSLIDDDVKYRLEYVNGTSLQELYIYNYLTIEDWAKILKLIDDMICKFKFSSKHHSSNLFKFLSTNYNNRVNQIASSSNIMLIDLMTDKSQYIMINGVEYYTNTKMIYDDYIDHMINSFKMDNTKYSQIIHGDLVFSNIIYNIGNNQITLIDPRGDFNGDIVYGDIRYDIAKLYQCIIGKYDYIVNDLTRYDISISNENNSDRYKYIISYEIFNFNEESDISELFNKMIEKYDCKLSDIVFITALQFLTMIPLHSENVDHQLMMYVKYIELMNEAKKLSEAGK